jgi:hypothetical protein
MYVVRMPDHCLVLKIEAASRSPRDLGRSSISETALNHRHGTLKIPPLTICSRGIRV